VIVGLPTGTVLKKPISVALVPAFLVTSIADVPNELFSRIEPGVPDEVVK
jgi:hypothetical protein